MAYIDNDGVWFVHYTDDTSTTPVAYFTQELDAYRWREHNCSRDARITQWAAGEPWPLVWNAAGGNP